MRHFRTLRDRRLVWVALRPGDATAWRPISISRSQLTICFFLSCRCVLFFSFFFRCVPLVFLDCSLLMRCVFSIVLYFCWCFMWCFMSCHVVLRLVYKPFHTVSFVFKPISQTSLCQTDRSNSCCGGILAENRQNNSFKNLINYIFC